MKHPLLLTFPLLIFPFVPVHAQLFAGEVPPGLTSYDPGIDIMLGTPFTADSASIEMDCDDFHDMQVFLVRGEPAIDAPNVASIRMIDDDLEVCAEGINYFDRPQYYDFGQPLNCTGGFDWQLDDEVMLGDFGGLVAMGPASIDDQYIAFRRGAQLGWMRLSFQLNGLGNVHLQVHEVLVLCGSTSVDDAALPTPVLHPNPTNGEAVRIEGIEGVQRIEVLDAAGRTVARHGTGVRTIAAPQDPGTYFVRMERAGGGWSVVKLVRLSDR